MQQEIMFGLMEVPVEDIFQIGIIVGATIQIIVQSIITYWKDYR